jgi:hypothetical protein
MRLRQTLDQPDLIHTVPDAYLIESHRKASICTGSTS